MGTRLIRRYSFAAAHKLACGAAHQCARLHGHTYDVAVTVHRVSHDVDRGPGWVIDITELDKCWDRIRGLYDHHLLNESLGEDSPTCEILARRLYEHWARELQALRIVVMRVEVSESPRMTAIYDG